MELGRFKTYLLLIFVINLFSLYTVNAQDDCFDWDSNFEVVNNSPDPNPFYCGGDELSLSINTVNGSNVDIGALEFVWTNELGSIGIIDPSLQTMTGTVPMSVVDGSSVVYSVLVTDPESGCSATLVIKVYIKINCEPNCGESAITINSFVEWDNVILSFDEVITIANQGELRIIDSEITFSQLANIVVEDGGKLDVIRSFLGPNNCTDFWPGIRSSGNGYVEITSSQLFYATIGVQSDYCNGYVIMARSNEFYNNGTGIRISRSLEEVSYLIFGNNIHSDEYQTDRGIDFFEINILDSQPQNITQNNFRKVRFGIYAQDANDGEIGIIDNVFNDVLETGIRFNNTQPVSSNPNLRLNISGSIMNNMKRGIIARKLSEVSITNNLLTTISHTGITLNDLPQYECNGNRIAGLNTGNQNSLGNRGISILGGPFSSNIIPNNPVMSIERDTIIRFRYGLHLNNYHTSNSTIETHCNQFQNNETAVGLFNNSHFDQQGDLNNATFNVFLNSDVTDISVNSNSSMGDYFYADCALATCDDFEPVITGIGSGVSVTVPDIMAEFCSFISPRMAAPVLDRIELKPNPTSGNLQIKTPISDETSSIFILNSAGQILSNKSIAKQTSQVELDLTVYPDGIYFIQYLNKNINIIERVVVAK